MANPSLPWVQESLSVIVVSNGDVMAPVRSISGGETQSRRYLSDHEGADVPVRYAPPPPMIPAPPS
jgi:hypothetical protein